MNRQGAKGAKGRGEAGQPAAGAGLAGAVRHLRRNTLSVVGSTIVLSLVVVAILAPFLGLANLVKLNVARRSAPPGSDFWFGADHLGRDVFSRVLHGARFSLLIGSLTVLAAGAPGLVVGILGATAPPRVANLIRRVLGVLMSFPPPPLAVAVAPAVGTGGRSIVTALSALYFPRIARMARGLGSPAWRVMARTVLPNCLAVIVVQCSLYFAEVLLAEADLSFPGLGEAPRPTWGNMLYEAQKNMRTAPWIAIFPGAAIAVSVLGLNLFGDAVRDAIDPRMRT